MKAEELLNILKVTEKLKCNTRHCYTSSGRHESVAEHCWQMTLMAMLLEQEFMAEFPGVDMNKVLRMCLIHDLGEAFTGDIPSFYKTGEDDEKEMNVLDQWVDTFPEKERAQWQALYKEMNAMETLEARIYKAMDKMEAVIEHDFSDINTWLPLEYELQFQYGAKEAQVSDTTKALKACIDRMTEEKIRREGKENPGSDKQSSQQKDCMEPLEKTSLKFIAHRGLSSEAPENTAKAFELAGKEGFWGCETDIHVTADGEYILLHDHTLKRMCGVNKHPEKLTLEKIRKLPFVSGNHLERYKKDRTATRICTLKEYLMICLEYDMVPILEIKIHCGANPIFGKTRGWKADDPDSPLDETMCDIDDSVRAIMGDKPYVYISFYEDTIREMSRIRAKRQEHNVKLQLLFDTDKEEVLADHLKFACDNGAGVDMKDTALMAKSIEMAHKAGVEVNFWTVDDVKRADLMRHFGADYVTSNRKLWS